MHHIIKWTVVKLLSMSSLNDFLLIIILLITSCYLSLIVNFSQKFLFNHLIQVLCQITGRGITTDYLKKTWQTSLLSEIYFFFFAELKR